MNPARARDDACRGLPVRGCQIVEWHEDQEGHDCVTAHLEAPPGQVELFDWDGIDLFNLVTFTLCLAFTRGGWR